MKSEKQLNKSKVPVVRINPSLSKYVNDTPFPEKLAAANKILATAKLPKRKKTSRSK